MVSRGLNQIFSVQKSKIIYPKWLRRYLTKTVNNKFPPKKRFFRYNSVCGIFFKRYKVTSYTFEKPRKFPIKWHKLIFHTDPGCFTLIENVITFRIKKKLCAFNY